MIPEIALQRAREKFRPIRFVIGGYQFDYESMATGEMLTSDLYPTKGRAQYARYREILVTAVSLCDSGARGFESLCLEWPSQMRQVFLAVHAGATGRVSRSKGKPWSAKRRAAQDARDAKLLEQWRRDAANWPAWQRYHARYGPIHPTHAQALAEARRRIMERRPDLAPATVETLARWLAGAP